MPLRMLLFDIDGTLLLTGGAGRVAIENSFEELFAISNAWGDMIPDGKTDELIFEEIIQRVLKRSLNEKESRALQQKYISQFREEIQKANNFRLMPGVSSLLDRLSQDQNILLGIQTGNFEKTAWMKLERGGIRDHFRFGGFGSDSSNREEIIKKAIARGEDFLKSNGSQPPSRSAIVIGDAPQDIRAGKALNLKTIAVTTGRASEEELNRCQPDYILEDFANINRFLEIISK